MSKAGGDLLRVELRLSERVRLWLDEACDIRGCDPGEFIAERLEWALDDLRAEAAQLREEARPQ